MTKRWRGPHRLLPIVAAAVMAMNPGYAADAEEKRRIQATVHLLAEAGKRDEAAKLMRSLYPNGPPYGGQLALEYYDVIGDTEAGRAPAASALEALVKADPYDVSYRLALALQLTRAAPTRERGMQLFADMDGKAGVDRGQLLGTWRRALAGLKTDAEVVRWVPSYLAVDSSNDALRESLKGAQQHEAKRLSWEMRKEADAALEAGKTSYALEILNRALVLDPGNIWVRFDIARIYLGQHKPDDGSALLAQGVALAPGDADALFASALYATQRDSTDAAKQFMAQIPADQYSPAMTSLQQRLATGQPNRAKGDPGMERAAASSNARREADIAVARGDLQPAADILQRALLRDTLNPWLHFDLARVLQRQGKAADGSDVMARGLAAAPLDPNMRYAGALYANGDDRPADALRLLDKIPEAQRSPAMRTLARQAAVSAALQLARSRALSNDAAGMQAAMRDAERKAGQDGALLRDVARIWAALGDSTRGMALLRNAALNSGASVALRLAYAQLLDQTGDDKALTAWLSNLAAEANLSVDDKAVLTSLALSSTVRGIDRLREAGDFAGARALATTTIARYGDDTGLLLAAARAESDAGDTARAASAIGRVLARDAHNVRAHLMLAELLRNGGDAERATRILDQTASYITANDSGSAAELARAYGETGDQTAALRWYTRALAYAPGDAWTRLAMARVYAREGRLEAADALMAEGLAQAPRDADTLHAQAVYLVSRDQFEAASRVLEQIPPTQQSPSVQAMKLDIAVRARLRLAHDAWSKGENALAEEPMRDAERLGAANANELELVANAWMDLNRPDQGLDLVRPLAQAPQAAMPARMGYARLLNRAERDDELAVWLDRLEADRRPNVRQRAELEALRAHLVARRVNALRRDGHLLAAQSQLDEQLQATPDDTDLLLAQARLALAAQKPATARMTSERVLGDEGADTDTRLAAASILSEAGYGDEARRVVEATLRNRPISDVDARVAVADWYAAHRMRQAALAVLAHSAGLAQDDPRSLAVQARLARADGDYEGALVLYSRAGDRDAVASIEASRAHATLALGINRYEIGDGVDGVSNLRLTEVPLELRMPAGFGNRTWFLQADAVNANAGMLPLGDRTALDQYGKILPLAPAGLVSAPRQAARGTALAVGTVYDDWSFDIGTTPLGFPVTDVVGGIKWAHYTATSGLSFELARRPVTSSLLAFAGARDPVSGEVWGGVQRTLVGEHVAQDFDGFGAFVDLSYTWLDGRHVLSNRASTVRTGVDLPLVQRRDAKLVGSLILTDWRYRENLRFYTFGHGGYYSPQRYDALTAALDWTSTHGRWSYALHGSLSTSSTSERTMPYFPTDAALQTLAEAGTAGATQSPFYVGGRSHGTGHVVAGEASYRLTPNLVVDASFRFEHSAYYTPNYVTLGLRYEREDRTDKPADAPHLLKPYSQY